MTTRTADEVRADMFEAMRAMQTAKRMMAVSIYHVANQARMKFSAELAAIERTQDDCAA